MFARSVSTSLRQAVARPAVVARAAAVRAYSAEAEAKPAAAEGEAGADEKKIAELEAKVKELTKDLQYLRADYQTLTRRSADEKAKAQDFAIQSFAKALLSTADVLTTALKHVPQPIEKGSPLESFFTGVELTRKGLFQTFELNGVKQMEHPVGKPFDPNHHDATFQVPQEVAPKRPDGSVRDKGEVIDVAKDGWLIKDRVLRPAQVGVVQIE
ncbi:hypothetical protein Q8F55_001422 [Vanrija albida]|uniref:GrpE protein homolog, mitochondrial n=1 Tax=Vanrija albida TaxID=181172 RepID=A0ABR3QFZ2_9TREE